MSDHHEHDDADGSDEHANELCDVCGAAITDESALYTLVPDSSFIHAANPTMDGQRLIVACTQRHLDQLTQQYTARLFVDEELWIGKIGRALEQSPTGRLQPDQLAIATGLTVEQIERAAAWHNARLS
ncbi:hypothetical protein ACFV9C_44665 [Kribbella sp. NPDC059898]|uniref:hypothetical protein n=1 Tax=Kribbella sp. NPDC059898 TaxID=3346995 RepID=UPI003669F1F7